MKRDAFSEFHPLVNFLYFVGAIAFAAVIQHPAYLLAGCVGAAAYYLLLNGAKGFKTIGSLGIAFIVLSGINPLFNTQGQRVLFTVFGRNYTWEALLYGAAIAAIFVAMMLWFGCYNAVMTGDKFTSLFGNLIPALSLLLVMVLRMVPNLTRKARQILDARSAIGKGAAADSKKDKLAGGMTALSALTSWALEGSLVTADSMRARGYGSGKRTGFQIYRMTGRDFLLLGLELLLAATVIAVSARGGIRAAYTPVYSIAPLSGVNALGFAAYCAYLLIPTILHLKETILWRISRSRI